VVFGCTSIGSASRSSVSGSSRSSASGASRSSAPTYSASSASGASRTGYNSNKAEGMHFEQKVATSLRQDGFSVKLSPGSFGPADMVATHRKSGEKLNIQCKSLSRDSISFIIATAVISVPCNFFVVFIVYF
jgi:hypothetical protein